MSEKQAKKFRKEFRKSWNKAIDKKPKLFPKWLWLYCMKRISI